MFQNQNKYIRSKKKTKDNQLKNRDRLREILEVFLLKKHQPHKNLHHWCCNSCEIEIDYEIMS